MEAAQKPIRIDVHMSNAGACHDPGWQSPTLNYMQHFSMADSLWFGEGFVSLVQSIRRKLQPLIIHFLPRI